MEKSTAPVELALPELEGDVFSSNQSRVDLILLNGSSATEKQVLDEEKLDYWLQQEFTTRIAAVCQPYSWAPLQVSGAMFRLFATLTTSMNELWEVAGSFRSNTSDVEQAFSTSARKLQQGRHEISYVFKYPHKKGGDDEPTWVIQQRGVYHQYDMEAGQSTWMLLFPNRESYCSDKIINNMKGAHPLQPHIGFHFAHFDQWRWYMADLEKEFHELAEDILNFEIEETIEFSTMYEQMSSLRYIQTRLSPLLPIFTAHHRVLGMLHGMNFQLLAQGDVSEEVSGEFTVALDSLRARIQSYECNAQYLLARITSTIQTASDTISLKSQNITEGMSHHMLRDSTAIRVITLVTLVYLPASFVATFFGMGFFAVEDDGNGSWKATPHTWLYFAVALPMSAVTLLYWKWKSRQTSGWTLSSTSPV